VNPLTEVYEHNPAGHEDPTAGPILFLGLVGVVVMVIVVLGVAALYYNVKADAVQDQVVSRQRQEVLELYRRQEEVLALPPGWVERQVQGETTRAYVIPIERAMELVVEEVKAEGGR
jgi:hypothetical protein